MLHNTGTMFAMVPQTWLAAETDQHGDTIMITAADAVANALIRPVTGHNLRPGTLGDQLGTGTTLLVFLRQSG